LVVISQKDEEEPILAEIFKNEPQAKAGTTLIMPGR
jgi:hypothetical protein